MPLHFYTPVRICQKHNNKQPGFLKLEVHNFHFGANFFMWSQFGATLYKGAILENGSLFSGGTVFFLNMIIKGKNGSLFAKGIRFPFQYTFLQCDLMITDPDY